MDYTRSTHYDACPLAEITNALTCNTPESVLATLSTRIAAERSSPKPDPEALQRAEAQIGFLVSQLSTVTATM